MVFQWVGVEDAKKRAKISLIGCGGDQGYSKNFSSMVSP